MVTRGEVWWYEHPLTGRRPHLVFSRPEAAAILNQVIAIPATRTIRGIPVEVEIGPADGMPDDCALNVDNITLIRPALCTEKITTLGPDRLRAVCDALAFATSC